MEAARSEITLVLVTLYLAACMALGVWAMRRTHSTRDFFAAGRNLGVWLSSVAIFSTTLSGFGFVAGPGMVYGLGMTSVWMIVAAYTGYVSTFVLLAKRMRLLAEARDCVSLPDAVAARYDSELARALTALAILLGVIGYLATQIVAMATVLQNILAGVEFLPELSLVACVVLSTAVLVFYCVTGGIIASVYTDLVQGAVMVVAAVLVFFAAQAAVDGGFAGMSRALLADDPASIGPWGTLGMLGSLSFFGLFLTGIAGQPHVITKLMMMRNMRDARRVLPLSLAGYTLSALLWVSVGLAMRALVVSGGHEPLARADLAAPIFLEYYAHPLLAGIVFAGLLAAIMSTADAFLNIGAAALVHDLPRAFGRVAAQRELFQARVATALLGVGAAGFGLYSQLVNDRLLAYLGVFGSGTFAAAFVPAVALGFNWKRATPLAANVAIGVSIAINLGVELSGARLPYGVHGGLLALFASLVLFLGISLASSPPRLAPDVELVLDA